MSKSLSFDKLSHHLLAAVKTYVKVQYTNSGGSASFAYPVVKPHDGLDVEDGS